MEDEDAPLPPGIGPHEGRELELMLAGTKPLAMFNDDLPEGMEPPEDAFDPHVRAGTLVKREITVPHPNAGLGEDEQIGGADLSLRYVFFALPDEVWRIDRLIEIQRGFFEENMQTMPALETEIGRLLGYDEADIETFVRRRFASTP